MGGLTLIIHKVHKDFGMSLKDLQIELRARQCTYDGALFLYMTSISRGVDMCTSKLRHIFT